MTKTAFAEKMDVARTTVSKWLAGHWSPDFHTTQKMAEILSVDIGELWSEDAPLRVDQDFYDQRLRELIADQPEHVKARILSMVAEELASRGPEESDEDDQPKEKK